MTHPRRHRGAGFEWKPQVDDGAKTGADDPLVREIRSRSRPADAARQRGVQEIGSGRLVIAGNAENVLQEAKEKAEKVARARHKDVLAEQEEESEHTRMQHLLIKIGRSLKYDVHVARNDRHRTCHGENFAMLTVPQLPPQNWSAEVMDTVTLIDVIWLKPGSGEIVSAFEIEKSTSIYSGILRHARATREGNLLIHQSATNRIIQATARRQAAAQ